jgi:hypothetical protein
MMRLDHLPNQRKDEKVLLFLRRFWITPFEIIFYMLGLYALPSAVAYVFIDAIENKLADPFVGPIIVLVASMYVLGVWLFGFLEFTDYYLDVWIVTNERIINIEQKGLFTRVASELHLSAVQDVTSEVKGVLHTLLDYGHVHIQTAGERTRFIFKDIPKPEKVKEEIIRFVDEDKKKHHDELVTAVSEAKSP